MSCELPIVATDVGFTRQELGKRDIGYLVEPGNEQVLASAICSLLADRERRIDMGGKGCRFAREKGFSRDAVAKTTLSLYEQVLAMAGT